MSDNIAYTCFPEYKIRFASQILSNFKSQPWNTTRSILLLDSNQQMVTAKVEIQQAFFRGEGGVQ